MSIAPRGMGLYVRHLTENRHGSPADFGRLLTDHGVSWVAIGGPWQDRDGSRWVNRPEVVERYSEGLLDVGVLPWVWGYPWWDRPQEWLDRMMRCVSADTAGVIVNAELGVKGHPEVARRLFTELRRALPRLPIALSSYGVARWHGDGRPETVSDFPWEAFGGHMSEGAHQAECDCSMPQVYELSERLMGMALRQHVELGFDLLVPSFGAFHHVTTPIADGGTKKMAVSYLPGELRIHLDRLMACRKAVPFDGLICWADNWLMARPALWRVIAEYADRLEE
uniref:Glycoside hydrolase n=1 Tax=viral metagenome TaxID=1070528 RepID=A0A6M3J7J6_9ZZZZ